jgi:LacI family transcriptional regulator
MAKQRKVDKQPEQEPAASETPVSRIVRAPSLVTQIERLLREAIRDGRYPGNKLPTEVQLAEQLGVSRETVRRATEALTAEGLLIKFRRKGTFLATPQARSPLQLAESTLIGYVQADYRLPDGQAEPTMRYIGNLMLDGALDAAAEADRELAVRRIAIANLSHGARRLSQSARLQGLVFASVGEEKLLRRFAGFGLPMVLLDHDVHLPEISTIRDDSAGGARLAVEYLASLGHRHIAIAYWHATDLNPWRLEGYREGLRQFALPRRRAWEMLTDLSLDGARQVAQSMRELSPRPTAVYCFNNSLARMIIDELANAGLTVPGDVSVIGGGGDLVPGLTHHQADWRKMGRRGVEVLLSAVASGGEHQPIYHLEPHVLHEGSTCCRAGIIPGS